VRVSAHIAFMSERRHFRDKIHLFTTRILSRSFSSDRRHQNSESTTSAPTELHSSSRNPPPNTESSPAPQVPVLEPVSSVKDSYKPLVPEALTTRDDETLQRKGKKLEEMGASGWNALETSLSVVNGVSDIFPPLKAAVGVLLGVMKHVDVRAFLLRSSASCDLMAEPI
jgi:hypothetical protein